MFSFLRQILLPAYNQGEAIDQCARFAGVLPAPRNQRRRLWPHGEAAFRRASPPPPPLTKRALPSKCPPGQRKGNKKAAPLPFPPLPLRATSSLPGHAGGEGSATCLGGRWSRAGGATASRAHSAPRGRLERSQMSLGWNERLSRRQGRRTFQKCSFVKGRESDSNEAGETLCWCCCLKPRAGCRGRAVLPRPAHVIRSHPACLEEKRRRPER